MTESGRGRRRRIKSRSRGPTILSIRSLLREIPKTPQIPEIVTRGRGIMGRVLKEIPAAAASSQPVLLSGPSGVGKELAARAIHRLSGRARGPFVAVNSAEVSGGVFESEIFGHAKGAFTGATGRRKGLFRSARGGILFLDEINRMPSPLQLKLLRAVEGDMETRAVGGDHYVRTDVRIISACNKGVKEALDNGELEWEIFWRLGVIRIYLPPLSDRAEDIPVLVAATIDRRANPGREKVVTGISRSAMRMLADYPWPGNVRQLQHLLQGILALHPEVEVIGAEHLEGPLADQPLPDATAFPLTSDGMPLADILRDTASEAVKRALGAAGGDKKVAARNLGISLRTLNRYLRQAREARRVARSGRNVGRPGHG